MSLFSKVLYPLGNWPWLRINPQSSLFVIYCLILTACQWLMSFTCIPVQIEPNKSPLRKRLLALLLWEMGHLSSPSRSCLGRLILIRGSWWGDPAGRAPPPQEGTPFLAGHCSLLPWALADRPSSVLRVWFPQSPFSVIDAAIFCTPSNSILSFQMSLCFCSFSPFWHWPRSLQRLGDSG